MTPEIPQHIRRGLAAVIDDLKNAVGQEAAKAYLARISNVESLESELGAELCDDSWMDYINEDCITIASDSSYPTPFSPDLAVLVEVLSTPPSGLYPILEWIRVALGSVTGRLLM